MIWPDIKSSPQPNCQLFCISGEKKHNYPVVGNWLYLTVIIDLWDLKVVGWSLSRSLKAINTVIPAWIMAVKNRPVTRELIFHSDRGIQYAYNEFRTLPEGYGLVKRSMSRKGNCWDNAVAESFFKNLKMEWVERSAACSVHSRRRETVLSAALCKFCGIDGTETLDCIFTTHRLSNR